MRSPVNMLLENTAGKKIHRGKTVGVVVLEILIISESRQ